MRENWVIEHDNGIKGQHGWSDGFTSLISASNYAIWLKSKGVKVYKIWRAE